MGRRTVLELVWLALGLGVTVLLFQAGAWAYPVGAGTIRWIGWVTLAAVTIMNAGPLARAWAADRDA